MRSISELHTKLAKFDTEARRADGAEQIAKQWKRIFNMNIAKDSAESFARYYREMNKTRGKKQSGGSMLSPAPLSAPAMVPGLNVATYGRFPIEAGVGAGTAPDAIQNLDVYFNTAQLKGCGTEDISLQVPKDMGSNQVGGSRRRRSGRRAARKTLRGKRRAAAHSRRGVRRQRGGDLLASLASRFSFSTAPPNYGQIAQHNMAGVPGSIPAPASPVTPAWNYMTTSASTINPGNVARIGDTFTRLAAPQPWTTTA